MSAQQPIPIRRTPAYVEDAVRTTLREALAARHLRATAIDPRTFGNRALELLREAAEAHHGAIDAFSLYELETAVLAAASVLLSSKLGRRLLTIEPRRVKIPSRDVDAVVSDASGARHLVRFERCTSDAARRELLRALHAAAVTAGGLPATLHLVSLGDGRVRTQRYRPDLRATA